ncbi:unnamed protein product [Eretmochelys imbricata]
MLNWTLTEPVSFRHGVCQGCPVSGQLYALVIKAFLCLLRQRLTGLALREPELWLVLLAYADDVLLVVQNLGDLVWVEACQAIYSAASSARVNWVKSSGGDRRTPSHLRFKPSSGERVCCSILAFTFLPCIPLCCRTGWGWKAGCLSGGGQDYSSASPCWGGHWCSTN